jgi:hypothetical protein
MAAKGTAHDPILAAAGGEPDNTVAGRHHHSASGFRGQLALNERAL